MSLEVAAEKGRISSLDAVRAVAILAVVATHSLSASVAVTQSYNLPKPLFDLFANGQFGVQVFFALSGWLIFSLYYKVAGGVSAGHYWSRRISRIWPLWIIFVVLYFLIYDIDTAGLPTWAALLVCLLFLGWTVGSLVAVPLGGLTIQQEMGHYLVFWLLRKRGIEFFLASIIIGYLSVYVANGILSLQTGNEALNFSVTAWLRLSLFNSWPFFVLGGICYLGYKAFRAAPDSQVARLITPRSGVLILIALGLGSLSFYAEETPGYYVFGFVICSVVLGVALNQIPFVNRAIWSIGRYSYFMYFFHFLVLRQLEPVFSNSGLISSTESVNQNIVVLLSMFILATGISWAVAWVSWKVIESPIMRVARKRFP